MYRHLLSVGGITLLSRGTGFLRDVLLASLLGSGPIANAFFVAFRLPNQFRAIFGEGAFNAAYVPSYSRVLQREGSHAAGWFASQIFTILLATQALVLLLAEAFTPLLVGLLAPGFDADPEKFARAVLMTRITFPYLFCMVLVTLQSGTLNAHRRFAAAAFAPVLLNVVMMLFLAVAWLFPDAGIAASVGVTVSGVAQLALMFAAARSAGVLERVVRPRLGPDVRRFFRALGPAVIGSAGPQIAIFTDTIIASLLPDGNATAYYAERIYQLPIGVIGAAAGTVLLPEMSRYFAAGDTAGALRAQNRTVALTIALAAPFFVAFALIPDEIMRGVFLRGKFTAEAASASASVLVAYGAGLLPLLLISSARSGFQARGNTTVPMAASLLAVAFNFALKLVLYRPFGVAGLAAATAAGAWINLLVLGFIGYLQEVVRPDETVLRVALAVDGAAVALGLFVVVADRRIGAAVANERFADVLHLGLTGAGGAAVYGAALVVALRFAGVRLPLRRRR
ncbi:murein biosynthesis integral membrane protein MurJ [Lichenibacterium dinghuense]|uniref:murein biosynthesis integral membrane protein MurJ n=1 Tax=Lichenibacterium dinghuense TaxID=2895977 RepID=UPI001F01E9A0|nr:murein biosynthesis integral membrane protein MurJ [Lichenibacterium sp. 6Y81]